MAGTVSLIAVAAVLLDTAVQIFPDTPLPGRLTAARLALVIGLVAVGVSGARWRDCRSPLDLPVALLLLAGTATTVLGGHGAAPLRGLVSAVAGYYLALAVLRRVPGAWRALLLLALFCSAVAGAVALAQLSQSTPTGFCRTLSFADANCRRPGVLGRSTGTFPNPNLLAAFVLLLGPFGAVAAARVRPPAERLVLLGLLGLGYVGLVTTFSRMGWFSALMSAGVVGGLSTFRGRVGNRTLGLVAALVGLITVSLIVATGSLAVRARAWGLALDAWREHPLVGVGLGRAGDVIGTGGTRIDFVHAHNFWLNWLLEAGPLALFAVVVLTAVSLRCAVRGALAGTARGLAGLAAMVGFFLLCLTDVPTGADRISVAMWLTLALVMAPHRRRRDCVVPQRRRVGQAWLWDRHRSTPPSAEHVDQPGIGADLDALPEELPGTEYNPRATSRCRSRATFGVAKIGTS